MFSGRHRLTAEKDGSYFVDRDATNFRHILNYLRNNTIKVMLETDVARELAIEAEYYGLYELYSVLCAAKIDISQYLGDEITRMRDDEMKLRQPLSIPKDSEETPTAASPTTRKSQGLYDGLVSVFEDNGSEGALAQMNQQHSADPMAFSQLLSRFGKLDSQFGKLPATVETMEEFKINFTSDVYGYNEAEFQILERLTPILDEKKILIAGGAVLRALTCDSDVRKLRQRSFIRETWGH